MCSRLTAAVAAVMYISTAAVPSVHAMEFQLDFDTSAQRARVLAHVELLELQLPQDQVSQMKLGFSRFTSDEGLERIAESVPVQMKQGLPEVLPTRRLSENEKQATRERILSERIRSQMRSVQDSRRSIDELLFSTDAARVVQARRATLREQLDSRIEALTVWKSLPLSVIEVESEKQLEHAEPRNQVLYPVHQAGHDLPSGVDLLIGGNVRRVGEYIHIEVLLYGCCELQDGVRLYRNILREEDIESIMDDARYAVLEQAANRELSHTRVYIPEHPEAAIYLGQQRQAIGQNQPLFLEPGEYELLIVTRYGESHSRQLSVEGSEVIRIELPPPTLRSVELNIEPYGVYLFRGALFEGITPFRFDGYSGDELIRLQRDGYRERLLHLPAGQSELRAELLPDTFSLDEEVLSARDDFYDALGLFALSVPLWVLSSAVVGQYQALNPNTLNDAALAQYHRWGSLAYVSNTAFRGISIALAVHSSIRLARYIRLAQTEHTGEY